MGRLQQLANLSYIAAFFDDAEHLQVLVCGQFAEGAQEVGVKAAEKDNPPLEPA